METLDKTAGRVRVTVMDWYPGGRKGTSRSITFYSTTSDEVFRAIESLPDKEDKSENQDEKKTQ